MNMQFVRIPPERRTIVTAGDRNYAWGVFLLWASARRWRMKERFLIGCYDWPETWRDFFAGRDNVRIVELPAADRRCVTVTKPTLMLQAETDYVTWVDSDGIFTGDCSDYLYGEEEAIYARGYLPSELAGHRFARLPATVSTWLRDVGSLPRRRDITDVCANVLGVSLARNRPLLEKWIGQMLKVLPDNVGIVTTRDDPYFQTDESVLNSLLSCWEQAPEITGCYRLNNPKTAYYAHFAYNPKPWQRFWTPFALRYYEPVVSLVEWCASHSLLPDFAPVPPTLQRRNEKFYRRCAPFAPYYFRGRKLLKKLGVLK